MSGRNAILPAFGVFSIMTTISARLQAVHARIAAAARKCGRNPDEIALLAVSNYMTGEILLLDGGLNLT